MDNSIPEPYHDNVRPLVGVFIEANFLSQQTQCPLNPPSRNNHQPGEELVTTAPPPTAPTALVQEALGTETQAVEESSGFSAFS